MKALSIIKYVFGLLGIAMLVGTFFLYRSTEAFLATSMKAEGSVVALVTSRSNDSTTYRPVVQFTTQDGQAVEFTSSSGSNPPSYNKGERVEVLYSPTAPQEAKINGFFSLWGGAVILGILGGVFFLIGAGIALFGAFKGQKDDYLRKHGKVIATEFQSVELNTALSVNGNHPYRILSHWLNPATQELHVFKSNNLWFDPSDYIENEKINVFIEEGNPGKYLVDTSFLPKLAK